MSEKGQEVATAASRWPSLAALAIVGIAVVLRMFRLGAQDLWIDEAFTARLVDGSLRDLLRVTVLADNHPPLYYAVLSLLTPLGRSEALLRLPSAAIGVATVPLAYTLAHRLFDRRTAIYSSLLLAVSPLHIYYSQEARMYALLLFFSLASVLFFLAALERNRIADWTGYALASVLAFYTHIAAVLVPCALALHYLCCSDRDHTRRQWLGTHAAMVTLCLPWVIVAVRMLTRVGAHSIERVSLSPFTLPYTFFTFCLGYFEGPSVADLHRSLSLARLATHDPWLMLAAVAFGGSFVMGMSRLRHDRERFRLITLLVGITVLTPYLLAILLPARYNVRYGITALPFFLIVTASGTAAIRSPVVRGGMLTVLVALSCHALGNWYFNDYYAKPHMKDAVEFVRRRSRASDGIMVLGVASSFEYYWPDRDLLVVPYLGPTEEKLKDYEALLEGRARAWLVVGREWDSDPAGRVRNLFASRLRSAQTATFPGVKATLYKAGEAN